MQIINEEGNITKKKSKRLHLQKFRKLPIIFPNFRYFLIYKNYIEWF